MFRFNNEPEEPTAENWVQFRRRILVVCYGNICRSPFAAALVRARLPLDTWQVASAGTDAVLGRAATARTSAVGAEFGVELSLHRSQPLVPELVQACGVILTMSRQQARIVAHLDERAAGRTRLLGAFAPYDNLWKLPADHMGPPADEYEVGDPVAQSSELHRECFDRLRRASDRLVMWLLSGAPEEHAPPTVDRWPTAKRIPSVSDELADL